MYEYSIDLALVETRAATASDCDAILAFIVEQGSNQYNYLPAEPLAEHVRAIESGQVGCRLAEYNGLLVGVFTYEISDEWSRYEETPGPVGYVSEGVVHRAYAGRGVGSILLKEVFEDLKQRGMKAAYAIRHEENKASARVMTKGGMELVEVFIDPRRRTSGSRKTAVCRREL